MNAPAEVLIMSSHLFQAISVIVAFLVVACWVAPQHFKFLLDKGTEYPSLGRQGQYTAMLLSSWALVTLTLTNHLTEWFFIGYMVAWGGAQFGSIWLKMKSGSQDLKKDAT